MAEFFACPYLDAVRLAKTESTVLDGGISRCNGLRSRVIDNQYAIYSRNAVRVLNPKLPNKKPLINAHYSTPSLCFCRTWRLQRGPKTLGFSPVGTLAGGCSGSRLPERDRGRPRLVRSPPVVFSPETALPGSSSRRVYGICIRKINTHLWAAKNMKN